MNLHRRSLCSFPYLTTSPPNLFSFFVCYNEKINRCHQVETTFNKPDRYWIPDGRNHKNVSALMLEEAVLTSPAKHCFGETVRLAKEL